MRTLQGRLVRVLQAHKELAALGVRPGAPRLLLVSIIQLSRRGCGAALCTPSYMLQTVGAAALQWRVRSCTDP